MAYREPGAYLQLVTNPKYATGSTPLLIPVIMGSGAQVLERTDVITRASADDADYLPMGAEKILSVGTTAKKATYFQSEGVEKVKDFKHTTGENFITWETTAANKPAAGENYYITYTYKVTDEQYEPRLVFLEEEVEQYYGSDFRTHEEGAPINRLAVAAKIAIQAGAPAVYVLQVAPDETTGKVTSIEYAASLQKYVEFINDAWRIVPVDVGAEINNVIDAHIEQCSSYEERKERTAIYGAPLETAPTDFNEVYTGVGDYAASKANKRIIVLYPDVATKMLADGNYHELDAPFIAAAYAGREAFLPIYRSKTRDGITVFHTLKGVNMRRKQMNMLAEKGVMILTQPDGPGTPIIIRHQLTTDMNSVQTKESSIVMIGDYASKYLRKVCEQYIGKYNITGETIALIQSSLSGGINQLKKDKVIVAGIVTAMKQDEDNPDTLLVDVRVKPPYPCNYINLTLFLE
jgi:5S rRNA maturation endonuclease (ribonuclease M5)